MKQRFSYILLMLLTLVGCKHFDEPKLSESTPQATNISIQQLREFIGQKTITIEQEFIIGGYVTSNDQSSNIYKTFYIEDGTSGIEVMAGLYDLHRIYPLGYYLTMNLKGCTVSKHYEALQVGLAATAESSYPTEYFALRAMLDEHIIRHDIYRPVAPLPLTIADLSKDLCGRLVSVADLVISTEEHTDGWQVNQEGKWSGYNIFNDSNLNKIAVYTSPYAEYAQNEIPTERIVLKGILQYGKVDGKDMFMIKMRDEQDCLPYQ